MRTIGIVDTTFARVDMGTAAEEELNRLGTGFRVVRRTVPGVKDLPVACKRLIQDESCDLAMALGMLGPQAVDRQTALVADLGLQGVQLATDTPILGVFVYEEEAQDEDELAWLAARRAREHARNAYHMLFQPEVLRAHAGTGQREGFDDAGPIETSPGKLS
ncbi:MAG: riboflavin synthase [Thermoplasmata archaeon]|nr:riboflavin synthase [Thermoplasmata archaeon]